MVAEFLLLSSFNKINENFKVEVKQMNFVIHLIILLQYNVIFIYYLKTRLIKFGQISFKINGND